MRPVPEHPCIGSRCARSDGITCADDLCDLEAGIYEPPQGQVTPEQMDFVRHIRQMRDDLAQISETNSR